MKNNSKKLLALLLSGGLAISGCGAANTAGTIAEQTETTDETETNQTGSTDETSQTADTEGTASSENTGRAVQPSDNADTSLSAPLAEAENDIPAPKTPAAADAQTVTGEQHSVVGIIIDATKYSIAIQTPDGDCFYLTIPETGVTGNLSYMTIGQMATLTYVGSLDENHASLTGISDSSIITGIYVEEYAFAIKIINTVKSMNMKSLSDLTNFPVFIDTGKYDGPINTSGEFEVIDNEKIFTEALVERIVNYNLFDLEYTDAGFVMGRGTPSITFDVDDDGILGIIGINSAPAPETNQ